MTWGSRGKVGGDTEGGAEFSFPSQKWKGTKKGRRTMPGIVLYARIDGGFSLWDPARNYWLDAGEETVRTEAYQFSNDEVWNGLPKASVSSCIA